MTWATATPQTMTPPPPRPGQGVVRRDSTTLDICLVQLLVSSQIEYIGLYLHPTEILFEKYLLGMNKGQTNYQLDIPVEKWKRVLEETLASNNLTSLKKDVQTLRNPPQEMYAYVFDFKHYRQVGQMLMPDFPPPFWDVVNKKR